jgi:hypothetical protein
MAWLVRDGEVHGSVMLTLRPYTQPLTRVPAG